MHRHPSLFLLALISFAMAGPMCNAPARIVLPAEGAAVKTLTVRIEVSIDDPDGLDPAGIQASLNESPIVLVPDGPNLFSVELPAGAPLQEQNELVVKIPFLSGGGSFLRLERDFEYSPGAVAKQITDESELIRGPLAHGVVGDFLLDNGVARFVIQRGGQRDLWSVGQYGGNIIDAELVGYPDMDNFLEIQPGLNIESVVNAQTVQVTDDGSGGGAAVVEACGPDDLLDFINPSSNIRELFPTFEFPEGVDDFDHDITACTTYSLEPGKPYLKMETTVFNHEAEELGLFVGDFINAAGEVDPWMNEGGGLGEVFTGSTLNAMSFIGKGEAQGVDYFLVPQPIEGSTTPTTAFLTVSGVTVTLSSHSLILALILNQGPVFFVPAGGSNSFVRYFGVGDGSGANGIQAALEINEEPHGTIEGCVTYAGEPAVDARVVVGTLDDGELDGVTSHFSTNADGSKVGCYRGEVPPGDYGVAAGRNGTPFEGGAAAPPLKLVTVNADAITTVPTIELPATGRLRVNVRDQHDNAVPARVSVVGFDPSSPDEEIIVVDGLAGLTPSTDSGIFVDYAKDRIPFGISALEYAGADGIAEFDVEPGDYQVFVSRGSEWSLFSTPVSIPACPDPCTPTQVAAQIAHVIDTPGFISSDFHVHGIMSADSRVNDTDRAMQFAGEGVDNVIMTEHNAHNDLNGRIGELGLDASLYATVGAEITTWDFGHFNGYPFTVNPNFPSGGSLDFANAAPPGMDFPIYGAFVMTPQELLDAAQSYPQSTPETVVQVNHIGSTFDALRIDTSQEPPVAFVTAQQKQDFFRIAPDADNPAFPSALNPDGNIFAHFPALELWNGDGRGAQSTFLGSRIGVWFNHLNQGLRTTFIADTDTHTYINLGTAGARTWTASSTDAPGSIDAQEVGAAVKAGRAVGGQGPYLQVRLREMDNPGNQADLTLAGSTDLDTGGDPDVELVIDVQSPIWAEYDRIEIYTNAATQVSGTNSVDPSFGQPGNEVPTSFRAIPDVVLKKDSCGGDPDCDGVFAVSTTDVFPEVAGAERLETQITRSFSLSEDTWFVVIVKGTDGVSKPMFPVFADNLQRNTNTTVADLIDGNLGESGVMALTASNALYADVDGNPGFDAPGVQLAP